MKYAAILWIALIFLCSCSPAARFLPPPPEALRPAYCPSPAAPALPRLTAALPLDAPVNAGRLKLRDNLMRDYIGALKAALDCYAAQTIQAD
jgi:hypothetical protein